MIVLIGTIVIGTLSIGEVAMGSNPDPATEVVIKAESIINGTMLNEEIDEFISQQELPFEYGS